MSALLGFRTGRTAVALSVATVALVVPAASHAEDVVKVPMTDKGNSCSVQFSNGAPGGVGLFAATNSSCTKTMRQVTSVHAIPQAGGSVPGGSDTDACHFEDPATPTGCAHLSSAILVTPPPGDYMVQHAWAGHLYNPVPVTNPAYERWGPAPPGCWKTNKGGEVMNCSHTSVHTLRPGG